MFVENPRSCSQNINPERGSAGNTTRSDFLYVFPEWFGYPEWLSGVVSVIYISRICFRLFPARRGQLPLGVASTPLNPRGHALEKSRPLSRVLSWTVIPLGCASPRSSSDLPGSLTWTTWCGRHAPRASLFGLAPGGVCRAADVATRAVRSYRTISPLPAPLARHLGGIFLLHFP